jgi:hypothetical protein
MAKRAAGRTMKAVECSSEGHDSLGHPNEDVKLDLQLAGVTVHALCDDARWLRGVGSFWPSFSRRTL